MKRTTLGIGGNHVHQWIVFIAPVLLLTASSCQDNNGPDSRTELETIEQLYQKYKQSFPQVPEISVADLLAHKLDPNVVLVDVRPPLERSVSMIPHAVSLEEFERRIDRYRGHMIVSYCTIGHRSGLYTKKLKADKLQAFNLKGGVLAWAHARQKFVDAQGETTNVHVYGPQWNLLPDGYQGKW